MIQLRNVSVKTDGSVKKTAHESWKSLMGRTDVGFTKTPNRNDVWNTAAQFGESIRSKYSRMVVLGIGGSSLGGKTLQEALAPWSFERLIFFENVDSRRFWDRIQSLPSIADTHWVIISKSGNTMETLTQAAFVDQYLQIHGLQFSNHATVISDPGSNPLTDWARENKVPCLEVPKDVGGRFSILTPVGLLPGAFLGVSLEELRRGAQWALSQEELICELAAQSVQSFSRQEWITQFWFYSDLLKTFGAWAQQLWAESLAKKNDLSGRPAPRVSTPVPLVGTNDQHSVLQQVMEGAPDKFTWFLRCEESESYGPILTKSPFKGHGYLLGKTMGELFQAEAIATERGLQEYGRHSLTISISKVSPATLGALFMTWELVVGVIGEMHKINTYDQPGVELGKRLAKEMLIKSVRS